MNKEKKNAEINIDGANGFIEHWQSFVGHTISNPAAELIFYSYDDGQFTVRHCCGNPEDYLESKGTPEEIAEQYHFDGDFREKFFDMDFLFVYHISFSGNDCVLFLQIVLIQLCIIALY